MGCRWPHMNPLRYGLVLHLDGHGAQLHIRLRTKMGCIKRIVVI